MELADSLRAVLDQLEPVSGVLWSLVESGYLANWFCYVGSHGMEHAVELDRETMSRLLALPGDLWLDVYSDDDDEDEDEDDGEEGAGIDDASLSEKGSG